MTSQYFRWTPEREAELIRRRATGERMKQIADALGTTYSSVANRSNRLLERGAIQPLEKVKRGFADPVRRFWSLVDKSAGDDGCWVWTGKVVNTGRGNVGFVVVEGVSPNALTHRMAYLLTHGSLPPKPLILRHTCDNGICCNPAHLIPGTYKDNAADCIRRGRAAWQRRAA